HMRPIFDSRDLQYKSPFGACPHGQNIQFSIHLPKMRIDKDPELTIYKMDYWDTPYQVIPMEYAFSNFITNIYSCVFRPMEPGLFAYCFEVVSGGKVFSIKRKADNTADFADDGMLWQLTVYHAEMTTPPILREGMFYQIFPDRFCNSGVPKDNVPQDRVLRGGDWGGLPYWRPDSRGEVLNNDYFGGDLQGIIDKLDYLESLGVTILYLNPIFEAHSNHRYNTADYMNVDPLLGTNEDFRRLCATAKKHGISVILDGVFNHTGSDSIYFNRERRYGDGGAYNDPDSPYRPWYAFSRYPDVYESWWGFQTLPNVNEMEPSYIEFICGETGVLRHWLKLGAAGFRLDVADELPDAFIDAINRCVKAWSPDCVLIGEVWEDASNKVSYGVRRRYLLGGQFDSIMNYPVMNALIAYIRYGNWQYFYETLMQVLENYPRPVISGLMNMLSTHDTPRVLTQLVGESMEGKNREWQEAHHYLSLDAYNKACRMYVLASILLFGLPGTPCVYYGDEAGLSGYRDPFNRVCYPWGHQNGELIAQISRLGELRRQYPIFEDAAFEPAVFTEPVCLFIRSCATCRILFAVNRSDKPGHLYLPLIYRKQDIFFLAGSFENGMLGPLSGIVIAVDENSLQMDL
ncbi:glycoside hydrolase family 13 protein, partial [Ruminococcaceae bacterium OttesenSCG-928-L11]|nr:glycoside hydrolase family 13 protein [Ruminococcaceae bacterium OttesenSCG-928-L11]